MILENLHLLWLKNKIKPNNNSNNNINNNNNIINS